MDDFFWHVEEAFLYAVGKPLIVIGAAFAALLAITIGLVIHSRKGSDDA